MQATLPPEDATSRRGFLKLTGSALALAGMKHGMAAASPSPPGEHAALSAPDTPPPGFNILFILTDQEHYFERWPFAVPGREALARRGTVFAQHQIASCVCSPSRSTLYTGQHIQHTGVFDNAGLPWQPDMTTGIRTVGTMLKDAGYATAYLGKWHLSGSLHKTRSPYDAPLADYNATMKRYGFDDYLGVGDLIGEERGGYTYDGMTTESAVTWMRTRAPALQREGKPWFLAVNLVNPHDVMFLDTDPPGSSLQNTPKPLRGNRRPPRDALYEVSWNRVPLAASRRQPYDEPGRPDAHRMYLAASGNTVGRFPFTDQRVRTYQDYYFNCMRDCDTHIVRLLDTLKSLDLDDHTIVVMTSDHGDHVGAHQLVGKGASAYREQNHVPFIIAHPAYPGGRRCEAVTSHIDVAPTLLGLTGLPQAEIARMAGAEAKGHSFAHLLSRPEAAEANTLREAALFNYSMLTFYDSEWMFNELKTLHDKGMTQEQREAHARSMTPDFALRGAIRSVFDGRYRFSRYFSLMAFNEPTSLEALFARNDVELYDLADDPGEMRNLALDRVRHGELLLAMNDKLNRAIAREVGIDSIDSLPIRDGKIQMHFSKHA